ncbi:MAG TPA: hypothetical protein VNU68_14195, partial [Verrucomicrobiae bacterium]|nr:hypothetical protein [Verrucomicrobiae bacterium]
NLKVQLRVSHPTVPVNDSCAGAEVIPASIPATGHLTAVTDTSLATTTAGLTPSCVPTDPDRIPSRDTWYRFTPAGSGAYTFSTKPNETQTTVDDTLISIYTSAADCDSFVEVGGGCNDNDVNRAAFVLNLVGGTPYYIVVWDNSPDIIPGETLVQLRVTPASAPTVITLPVVSIASTGAVLSGSINANGLRSSFWFEWGPTSGLGSTSRVRFVFGTAASAIVTNLVVQPPFLQTFQPNSTYFYRFVATNDSGMGRGEEQQFVWSNLPPHLETPVRTGTDVRLQFNGNPAQLYLIQSATNLTGTSAWADLGLATNTSGNAFQYLHRRGGTDTNRLYRLILP